MQVVTQRWRLPKRSAKALCQSALSATHGYERDHGHLKFARAALACGVCRREGRFSLSDQGALRRRAAPGGQFMGRRQGRRTSTHRSESTIKKTVVASMKQLITGGGFLGLRLARAWHRSAPRMAGGLGASLSAGPHRAETGADQSHAERLVAPGRSPCSDGGGPVAAAISSTHR